MKQLEFTSPEGKTIIVDSPDGSVPSEQELDQMFQGVTTQTEGFSTATFDSLKSEPSPTSFMQNLMLSFLPDDAKLRYIQNEFSGANAEQDKEGNILVNGARINPQGFDLGDIPRSAGYVFPMAGQILGSLFGGATGSAAGPAGTIAGGVGGGIVGSQIGESLRLAVPEVLGFDLDQKEVFHDLAENAKYAAIGEVVGLGIAGAGQVSKPLFQKLGQARLFQAIGGMWQKTLKKVGPDLEPTLVQFAGAIDPNATKIAMREGHAATLNPEYFDPQKTSKIVKNTLFGGTAINDISLYNAEKNGLKLGTYKLAETIEEIPNDLARTSFADLMKISGDTKNSIVANGIKNIASKEYLNPQYSFDIADNIIKSTQNHLDMLGEQLGKARLSRLGEIGKSKIGIADIGKSIDDVLKQTDILSGLKVPGFQKQIPIDVKGKKQLLQIRDLFKAIPEAEKPSQKFLDEVSRIKSMAIEKPPKWQPKIPTKPEYFDYISLNQANKINNKLDILADEVFLNKNIPSQIKSAVAQIADTFRTRFDTRLGLTQLNKEFSTFKNFTTPFRIDRATATQQMENIVRGYRAIKGTTSNQLDEVLSKIPSGNKLSKQIDLYNSAQELLKVDPKNVAVEFEGLIGNKSLLDISKETSTENYLKQLDDILGRVAPKKQFYVDAQKSLAAKEFLKGTPNILRISTIASMTGLGGLMGGPAGGLLGLGGAITLTNPKNIAKLLVSLEKGTPKRILENALHKTLSPVKGLTTDRSQAILRALLSQQMNTNASQKQDL